MRLCTTLENLDNIPDGETRKIINYTAGDGIDITNGVISATGGGSSSDITIVESGSNSNGDYIKYSDGHMECYKTITVTGINITNKWVNLYENSSAISLGNFAQTFKERPTVILSKSEGQGCWVQVHDNITTTSAGRCYVASATNRSNASLTFEIIAKGKWK